MAGVAKIKGIDHDGRGSYHAKAEYAVVVSLDLVVGFNLACVRDDYCILRHILSDFESVACSRNDTITNLKTQVVLCLAIQLDAEAGLVRESRDFGADIIRKLL